jgi:hypothetical protein
MIEVLEPRASWNRRKSPSILTAPPGGDTISGKLACTLSAPDFGAMRGATEVVDTVSV